MINQELGFVPIEPGTVVQRGRVYTQPGRRPSRPSCAAVSEEGRQR
jgi:hypothetical protein